MTHDRLIAAAVASMSGGADVATTLAVVARETSLYVPRSLVGIALQDVTLAAFRNGVAVELPSEELLRLFTTGRLPYNPLHVPAVHRNRWVEPIGSLVDPARYAASPVGLIMAEFDVFWFGRYLVCEDEHVVAVIMVWLPTGEAGFHPEERTLLATAAAAVAPLVQLLAIASRAIGYEAIASEILDNAAGASFVLGPQGKLQSYSQAGQTMLENRPALRGHLERLRPRPPFTVVEKTYPALGFRLTARKVPSPLGAHIVTTATPITGNGGVTLTTRQNELLDYVEQGLTNAQIGQVMGIASSTVKTMLQRLYARTGTAGRAELVHWRATET